MRLSLPVAAPGGLGPPGGAPPHPCRRPGRPGPGHLDGEPDAFGTLARRRRRGSTRPTATKEERAARRLLGPPAEHVRSSRLKKHGLP